MQKIICLALFVLTGCSRSHDVYKHDFSKNYNIGKMQTAYIGQPVVKVKDFYRKVESIDPQSNQSNYINYVIASDNFILTGTFVKKLYFNYDVNIEVKKDKPYQIKGGKVIDGVAYKIVDVTDVKGKIYGLLMNEEGDILSNIIYNDDHDHLMLSQDAVVKPLKIMFVMSDKYLPEMDVQDDNVKNDEPELILGNINYELIYGGKNNITLSMTYREFTADDLARPSFYQNIVYETSAKQLRFKETLIDVIEASNEKIVYTIVEDGLKTNDDPAENKSKYEYYLDKSKSKKK